MRIRHPSAARGLLRASLLAAAVLAVAARPLAAQRVHVVVLDPATRAPVPAAAVTLVPDADSAGGVVVKAGADGAVELQAPAPGVYHLRAVVPGGAAARSPAIELRPGDQIRVALRLQPDTARLAPIVVQSSNRKASMRLSGFQQRMQRHTFGTFISRNQLEQRNATQVSDVLATVPGLEVRPSPRGFGNDVVTAEGCRPTVYLDGMRYPLLGGETIDEIVSPTMLEGIEVYPHASEVPVELQSPGSTCGAIALWTRTS
jgi:hypothetical protein